MKTVTKEREILLNKSLAYFMGWRIDNSFPDKDKVWRKGLAVELETTLKFSTDWNMLMEVFEAINSLDGYMVQIVSGYCCVFKSGDLDCEAPHKEPAISTQEAVYRCLGEFIERYNESQTSK